MSTLIEVLERARTVGFLGPGPIASHIEHAEQYGPAVDAAIAGHSPTPAGSAAAAAGGGDADGVGGLVDIGAGGGVPSLPLLVARPELSTTLVDASQKRCSFLVWAAAELGMSARVAVWCGRAETIGHEDRARQRFAVLVARGFGPPASTLECAAPLVAEGGSVVVSEPPERRQWPAEVLAERLGLVEAPRRDGVVVFERRGPIDPAMPRSIKEQQRAPLFVVD